MQKYLELLNDVLTNGRLSPNRTGRKAIRLFGTRMRFNLKEGFPLLTTKEVSFHNIKEELLWFLSGSTNVNDLKEKGVNIWNEWATENGNLGPIYGHQWRRWDIDSVFVTDQINELIFNLKENPFSRRHIISAWNVEDLPDESISPQENVNNGKMALAPCHLLSQFFVDDIAGVKSLSCQVYQRSADMFLGVPYNIASYALLTHILASICSYEVGELIWLGGDTHIYENHIDQVKIQLERKPFSLPNLYFSKVITSLDELLERNIQINLINYFHHNKLKGEVSV